MADMARDLDVNYEVVKKWKPRNRIPSVYWSPLVRAGKKRGIKVSFEKLAQCKHEILSRAA